MFSSVLSWALGFSGLLALSACAPTHDWRAVRLEGGLIGMLPCRPVTDARTVPLGGPPVRMQLSACDAGGQTWALAAADVDDSSAVAAAVEHLRLAARANIRAAEASMGPAIAVRGATTAAHDVLTGQMPDGRVVKEQVLVFSRGTWVFQATVVGEAAPAPALETFFAELRLADVH